ncbi:PilZ domain-containing protein [Krasilnikovia sp. MM14-A1259]|uniref:PilZ domain-containing protein n=1 Tax=Krasilnikovia sp. MM14-A1259 TaxID=3373539 RepID=UPI003808B225
MSENVGVKVGALLHLTGDNQEWAFRAREASGDAIIVVAANGNGRFTPPLPGTEVQVCWNQPPSRYLVSAVFRGPVSPTAAQWRLKLTGEPKPSTRRSFFRGGGGEDIKLLPVGTPQQCDARVVNLSEGGVRFRYEDLQLVAGETIDAGIALGDTVVAIRGPVLSAKETARGEYEAVVIYDLGENESQQVRRYLMAWELERRRRERDDW